MRWPDDHALLSRDSSSALLEEDVLGSYLLCPHPKKPKCGSLLIRLPSGLVTYLIENSRNDMFHLEVTPPHRAFYYSQVQEKLSSKVTE